MTPEPKKVSPRVQARVDAGAAKMRSTLALGRATLRAHALADLARFRDLYGRHLRNDRELRRVLASIDAFLTAQPTH